MAPRIISRDDEKIPEIKAVLAAVYKLSQRPMAREDADVARVLGAALQRVYGDIYVQHNPGVKLSNKHACFSRLLGKRCPMTLRGTRGTECDAPTMDHGEMWIKDGKPFSVTWHPYNNGHKVTRELADWIVAHSEFDVMIGPESWYFPWHTTVVEVRRKGGFGY